MGRKRRIPPRKKPPRTAAEGSGASPSAHPLRQEQSDTETLYTSAAYCSIKDECHRAFQNNFSEAQRSIKELCLRHENCGLVHRMEAQLHSREGLQSVDATVKQRHLKKAIESAKCAVTLSPNSIEFSDFYSKVLLHEMVRQCEVLVEEVVTECERALSIENPVDPKLEGVIANPLLSADTPKERIGFFQNNLMERMQKSRAFVNRFENAKAESSEPVIVAPIPVKTNEEPINTIAPIPVKKNEEPINTVAPIPVKMNEERINTITPIPVKTNEERINTVAPIPVKTNEEWINTDAPIPVKTNEERINIVAPIPVKTNEERINTDAPIPVKTNETNEERINTVAPIPVKTNETNEERINTVAPIPVKMNEERINTVARVPVKRNEERKNTIAPIPVKTNEEQIKELEAKLAFAKRLKVLLLKEFVSKDTATKNLVQQVKNLHEEEEKAVDPKLLAMIKEQPRKYGSSISEEKSEAAREAILSVLGLEDKKNTNTGGTPAKDPKGKSKHKKKNKAKKKAKASKATCGDDLIVVQEENTEPIDDELQLEEEEIKRKVEMEEDERKPEEMLEHQKLVEDGGKKQNLSSQTKNEGAFITAKLEKTVDISDDKDVTASHQVPQLVHSQNVEVNAGSVLLNLKAETTDSSGEMPHEKDSSVVPVRARKGRPRSRGKVKQQFEKKCPSTARESVPLGAPSKIEDVEVSTIDSTFEDISRSDAFGPGLRNDAGESNCFLNVIVQSLWHLRKFRDEFLSRSAHVHYGDPCVVCALQEVFNALSVAAANTQREPVSSMSLRISLSNLNPKGNLFQEGQMNDASEVLDEIFTRLHKSCATDTESSGSRCTAKSCTAHNIFGINIFEKMICSECGIESRQMEYPSFFYLLNASLLRAMKAAHADKPFDELCKFARIYGHQESCDSHVGGRGKLNSRQQILLPHPQVFALVIVWQADTETEEYISATLGTLSIEMDIGIMFDGLDTGNLYSLVSMVCYYRWHYSCFTYNREHQKWIIYNDETVKDIGSWDEVISKCKNGRMQPLVLFFEAQK